MTQRSSFEQKLPARQRASLEKLTDDEKLEKRRERLIGRTVKGVLIRNRQNFAVKWNDCQFDNVYISERCVELSLGPRPERGIVAVVKCEIKTMGPANAPWYLQHPYTDVCELVTRYRRKQRSSGTRWLHSGMPSAIASPLFSRDASTLNSRRASITQSARGSAVVDTENLPKGLLVISSRRGSQVIIDSGKRWEYKPSIRGGQILAPGWQMAPVRHEGCTYFVPSPPGSRINSRRGSTGSRGPRRKPGRRGSTGGRRRKKKRPSKADKEAAQALIKQIEQEERRESQREISRNKAKAKAKSAAKAKKKRGSTTSQTSKSAPKTKTKKQAPKSKSAGTSKRASKKKTKKPTAAEQRARLTSTKGISCRKCDKKFGAIEGLMDHLVAKHGLKESTAKKAKERSRQASTTSKKSAKKRTASPSAKNRRRGPKDSARQSKVVKAQA